MRAAGHDVRGYDIAADPADDTRDADRVAAALREADGVVHLAAMSRVAWAHADPDTCLAVNVGGTAHVVEALRADQWILFASSREVYGSTGAEPVTEAAPLQPLNVYARAKVEGEARVAAHPGISGIVRLSNVYGPPRDHADRVVPAFARAAARGEPVRVDGADRTFDFVHLDDVVRGLCSLVGELYRGASVAPVHLTTGVGTSLGELAALAQAQGATAAVPGPERDYDVTRFVGDHGRATERLGWTPRVSLDAGFSALVEAFRQSR